MTQGRGPVIRWTVGHVHPSGFQALRFSVWGARRLFGAGPRYVICVNSVPLEEAKRLTGEVPADVEWRAVGLDDLASFIRPHLDAQLAEGVGWKFAPFRIAEGPELALDNDCILWDLPEALRRWRDTGFSGRPVIAEDVRACFGQFTPLCGDAPRNSGIRALPSGFDLRDRMGTVLEVIPALMVSELDEQGLQVAALSADGGPDVVTLDEVAVCSPFPPHLQRFGRCGVHFVGLNARALPWDYYGRPAVECLQEHWEQRRGEVARLVGLA